MEDTQYIEVVYDIDFNEYVLLDRFSYICIFI